MHSTSHTRRKPILQLIAAVVVLHGRGGSIAAQPNRAAVPEEVAIAPEEAATVPEEAATALDGAAAPEQVEAARGQTEVAPGTPVEVRPWARGVAEEQQHQALAHYAAGTEALKDLQFSTAVARYREALKHWDHPSIHYHLAVALMNVEQPLEAYHNVLASLRYGGEALHAHERLQALQYKAVLQQRVGTLDVNNGEPDSVVLIDGERLRDGTGQNERVMLAGKHHVVVRKPGFVTWSDSLVVEPGTRVRIEVRGRREIVSPWIPWALVGAGVAMGGLGAALHWRAHDDMDRFDDGVANLCATNPCRDDAPATQVWLMERAYREQHAAMAAYVVGAGTVIGGLVLAWINPERSFYLEQRRVRSQPSLVPVVSPTSVGMSLNKNF